MCRVSGCPLLVYHVSATAGADEALYLKTFSKEPGLGQVVKPTVMDMKYATQFEVRKRCVRNESAI